MKKITEAEIWRISQFANSCDLCGEEDDFKKFLIKIKVGNDIYRIFCFFDKGNLIILLNGFQKKTGKTPKNEIEKTKHLRRKYYEEKSRK